MLISDWIDWARKNKAEWIFQSSVKGTLWGLPDNRAIIPTEQMQKFVRNKLQHGIAEGLKKEFVDEMFVIQVCASIEMETEL